MEIQATAKNRYLARSQRATVKASHIFIALCALLLVLNGLLASSILVSEQGIRGLKQQNQQVEEVLGKIRKLEEDNQRMFQLIQSLKSNTRTQERLVRQQLGWARENELVFEFSPSWKGVHRGK
ncbi:MAG: hypothetical protein GX443_07050 [Deltaproteobacteria bacterium]|nr:hypothetical protein [Deltaproteobacteria bacterium]